MTVTKWKEAVTREKEENKHTKEKKMLKENKHTKEKNANKDEAWKIKIIRQKDDDDNYFYLNKQMNNDIKEPKEQTDDQEVKNTVKNYDERGT